MKKYKVTAKPLIEGNAPIEYIIAADTEEEANHIAFDRMIAEELDDAFLDSPTQILIAEEVGYFYGHKYQPQHICDLIDNLQVYIAEMRDTEDMETIPKWLKQYAWNYFRDVGIFLALLHIQNKDHLFSHPKLGAAWEGFAMEQVIGAHHMPSESCYYWGIHQQAELDLLLFVNGKRLGFEFKYQDAPVLSKSMHTAIMCLGLDELIVIYPGKVDYRLAEYIQVIGLEAYVSINRLH